MNKTVRVTFDLEVPDEASIKDIEDWVAFELHQICSLPKSILSDIPFEATEIVSISVL